MKEIYETTWAVLRRNPGFYLGLAALLGSAEALLRAIDPRASGTLVPWVLVAYSLHRLLLLGEGGRAATPRPGVPGPAVFRFLFVTLLLLGISLAVPFAVLLWSLPRVDPRSLRPDVVVDLLFLGAGAMHGLVLAAFGTALPAAAVRDRFGPRLTLRRARRTAWAVLLGFLVGPAAGGLVLTVATSALDAWWEPVRATMAPRALGELLGLLALVPLQLARLVNATLMAVVLCRAYRAVAPPTVAAVLEPHPTLGEDLGQRAA